MQITDNPLFGLLLTVGCYVITRRLYLKTKKVYLNPILVSAFFIVGLLLGAGIPHAHYEKGATFLNMLLPFTVILLALPLYRNMKLLKEFPLPILAGIGAGVVSSTLSIIILCKLLHVEKELLAALLPKSITTPLGMALGESLGVEISITVVSIVVTGILGVLVYPLVFKLFKIDHPVAKGVALGTASHAVGTSKALELGEKEGAMSSLALVLTGITTVALTPLLIVLLTLL